MGPLTHRMRYTIRPVDAADTRALRRSVLRPHQDASKSVYPNDDAPATFHVGAFDRDRLVGVASMYHEAMDGGRADTGWRIRGMATEPTYRGRGIGGALVEALIERARQCGGTYLWCNARTTATPFYDKCGFHQHGDAFDLPGIGPHFKMMRDLVGSPH